MGVIRLQLCQERMLREAKPWSTSLGTAAEKATHAVSRAQETRSLQRDPRGGWENEGQGQLVL